MKDRAPQEHRLAQEDRLALMSLPERFVYAAVFFCMALVVLLNLDRAIQSDLRVLLLLAGVMGFAAMIPGVLLPRLRSLTLLMVPLMLYGVFRLLGPLPADAGGVWSGLAYYFEELRLGVYVYMGDLYPLTVEGAPSLQLLVLTFVALAVAASTYLGVVLGRPLLGSAGLFTMLIGALAVDLGHSDRWGITAFLLLFALLLFVSRPGPVGARWAGPALGALLTGGVGVVLAGAVLVAAPGLAAPESLDWKSWGASGPGSSDRLVFNWRQNYPRLLDPGNRFPLMTVDSGVPYYWRANTLEAFTGDSWLAAGAFRTSLGDSPNERLFPDAEAVPLGSRVRQRFNVTALLTSFLFVGGQPQSLDLRIPVEVSVSDSGAFRVWKTLGPKFTYSVVGFIPRVRPADVVGAGRDYPEESDFRRTYLGLPLPTAAEMAGAEAGLVDVEEVSALGFPRLAEFEGIYELNREIVQDAEDPYEIALRVERFLRSRYAYSLSPPRGRLRSPYADFLLETKKGFCQHFAGSMALLLRLNGVPARVAVGFLTGEKIRDRSYLVTSNDAHSWVEVYFPGYGWLPFEPTPGNALPVPGVSATSPGFADPFAERPGGGTDGPGTEGETGAAGLPPEEADFILDGQGGSASGAHGGWKWWVAAALLAALLLYPHLRKAVEVVCIRRSDGRERLSAEIRAMKRELRLFGLIVGVSSTLDELTADVRRQVGVDLGPEVYLAQAVLFGGSPAAAEAAAGLAAARPRLRRALRREAGRRRVLLAWYGVPSLMRRRPAWPGGYVAEGER
jgi:hypothetical protein